MINPPKLLILLSFCAVTGFGAPCLPGSLQDYYNLGGGCDLGPVLVSGFTAQPGQAIATQLDPTLIQVTPGGTPSDPNLLFSLNTFAASGEVFESFFSFMVLGPLLGATIDLTAASAAADGAVTGVLDICPDAAFIPPLTCSTTPATVIVFAIEGDQLLSDSAAFPLSSFFDVFVDLTIDGGLDGSASLESATVGFASSPTTDPIPEPATAYLMLAGLGALAVWRLRRAP